MAVDQAFKDQVKNYVEKATAAGVSKIGQGRFIEMKYKEYLSEKETKREQEYQDKLVGLKERELEKNGNTNIFIENINGLTGRDLMDSLQEELNDRTPMV